MPPEGVFLILSKITLIIGSVTYATKARKILMRSRIESEIIKITSKETQSGCTYGIKFDSDRIYDAVMQLKENGIAYSFYSK